jgi:methylation protein EvaC
MRVAETVCRMDYPFLSSSSSRMSRHFLGVADELIRTALTGSDPFLVEIGSNDGTMLRAAREAGVRHLGFEPSGDVAQRAAAHGVRVVEEFVGEDTAREVAAAEGRADVIFAANTMSHIPDLGAVLRGVRALLAPDGVFVFEDPYVGDVIENTAFDQIYDEHFSLFSARSVGEAARRCGLELVDVRRVPVHGGEVRCTLARRGGRPPSTAVGAEEIVAKEPGFRESGGRWLVHVPDLHLL